MRVVVGVIGLLASSAIVCGLSGSAFAIDLTGSWATDPQLCNMVFTVKDGKVAFSELSDLYGSGFIINGNQIQGKAAKCTITSRKEEADSLTLAASCATAIMNQNVQFLLKVNDDNRITRVFPDISGMTLSYSRCKL